MSRCAALLIVCLIPFIAAAEDFQIEVQQRDARYAVTVEMWIEASATTLHDLLTDYEHLDQLNDSILKSEVRETFSATRHHVYTFAEVCVAIFCRELEQVQEVEQRPGGDIVMMILPNQGDFAQGYAYWHFEPARPGTRITFESELEPAFWVPPVIGPFLIKHALWREIQETVGRLEALAVTP